VVDQVRLLLVEADDEDALLIERRLAAAGYPVHLHRVRTEAELRLALTGTRWDVVLTDRTLPDCDPLAVVRSAAIAGQDVPVVLMTRSAGEAAIIAALRSGADDHVDKDHLGALGAVIERALRHAAERAARRSADSRAEQSATLLAAVIRQLPEGVAVVGPDGRLLLLNDTGRQMFGGGDGWVPEDEPATGAYPVHDPATGRTLDLADAIAGRSVVDASPAKLELVVRQNGTRPERYLRVSLAPLPDRPGSAGGTVAILTDLTRERRLVNRVRASSARLRALYQAIPSGVLVAAAGGELVDANGPAAAILGLPVDSLRGRRLSDLAEWADAEGRPIDPLDLPTATAGAAEAAVHGRVACLQRPDGAERWVQIEVVRMETATGGSEIVAGLIDITELQERQQQAIEGERLRALGEMASGVAHDFNNLLGIITGRGEILEGRLHATSADTALLDHVRVIKQAARDGAETIRRLQAFTGAHRATSDGHIDLAQVVQDVVEFAQPRWKDAAHQRGATITVEVDVPPIEPMRGRPADLREVLINLVFNAIDAMPHGGALRIAARRSDGWVHVHVSDSGIGMTEAVRRRIFEPFFTTKGGRGTGLGLSMAYGIVQSLGGRITVESQPLAGTTFEVALPFQPAPAATATAAVRPSRPLRVLLVDDEPDVLSTMALLLEADGHSVVLAENGADGFQQLRAAHEEGAPFDVILTDLGMPIMNGLQLVATARAHGIVTPAAMLTGWGLELQDEDVRVAGISTVLAKPCSLGRLRATLADLTSVAAGDPPPAS
jgi:PAS domain S-box-containing protein